MSSLDLAPVRRSGSIAACAAMADGARAAWRELRDWHEARKAIRRLRSLSDAELKDIGIPRGQIEFMVRSISIPFRRSGHADH